MASLLSVHRNRAVPYARSTTGAESYPQILLKTQKQWIATCRPFDSGLRHAAYRVAQEVWRRRRDGNAPTARKERQVKTVNLADWEDILTEFERFAGGEYLFRGHADARWELKTSLERQTPGDMKASDAEARLLHEFKRRAHT